MCVRVAFQIQVCLQDSNFTQIQEKFQFIKTLTNKSNKTCIRLRFALQI